MVIFEEMVDIWIDKKCDEHAKKMKARQSYVPV